MSNTLVIKKCDIDEITQVKNFVHTHWSANHIMSENDTLIDWQHKNETSSCYNFWIAKVDEEIVALLGFISATHFDSNMVNKDYWGAIWKVLDIAPKGVGIALLQKLLKDDSFSSYGAIGINERVKELYSILGLKTGHLDHYYIANAKVKDELIGRNLTKKTGVSSDNSLVLKEISDVGNIELLSSYVCPMKSITYLRNRYQNHPVYKYKFYGVYLSGELTSIWVIRKQFQGESSCLRIVDVYGDMSKTENLENQFQSLLEKENAEYIDCLNYGIDENIFNKIGFSKLDHDGDIIIPNYFEPFERRNVKIQFAVKTKHKDYVIFKGDADQDRPNQL